MLTEMKFKHGVVLKYDPTIKPGDLITAYHKGFWIVTKVTQRKGSTPYLEYRHINKKVSNGCDSSHCRKVDPETLHKEMVAEADKVRDMLLKVLSELE